jgi:2-keto-4-pentenoate hydratase
LDVADAARRLYRARAERRPIQPLSNEWGELDERLAYDVQRAVASLVAEPGAGFKLGYTSAAMRAQMNVDTPNYGVLFASTRIGADGIVASHELIHPLVEPEIALVLARDVDVEVDGAVAARALVDAVMPALEIVDTRYVEYRFSAVDNIADNSSAARFVLGRPQTPDAIGDLRAVPAELRRDGRAAARGTGADVMGDPLLALAWFLSRRVRDGYTVPAGSIILTGGITAAQTAPPGAVFEADFARLGTASCAFVMAPTP